MMDSYGKLFTVTLFGESHGPAVGCVVDGVPAGTRLDRERIEADLARRAPGQGVWATPRTEADVPEILSGVLDGRATGAPIAVIFRNTNTRSGDYAEIPLRPGQADWTSLLKYGGYDDRRGGGRFSGRLTAGLVFAGAIAKQLLAEKGVTVYGRVQSVAEEADSIDLCRGFGAGAGGIAGDAGGISEKAGGCPLQDEGNSKGVGRTRDLGECKALLRRIAEKPFPAADETEALFLEKIIAAKDAGDSVGGVVEAVCFGLPPGTGEPFFGSVESRVSAMLFSIPAVKGIEFGRGFAIAALRGSEANDPILPAGHGKSFVSTTNNNGGLLGGIANGMPVIVRAAIKPTASISLPQDTVDPKTGAAVKLELEGRHDPCIAPRAVPVVEAGLAIALIDLLIEGGLF
ncbi:MAG: chorismate synthase [Clostridiales Family XIII bacterium]|jgi:chorismate synthase|nr:chorismate synthase [Clostridiales Family XIII bacterium]